MAIVNLVNFGGEVPRATPRTVPAGAAQRNVNLMATATEFRPMLDHGLVMTGMATAAKTLWRGTRQTNGARITDDVSRWVSFPEEFSFVKGQLNDDATDRGYVTRDDGTVPPLAFDVSTTRRLGIPAPAKPVIAFNQASQFTLEDATAWYKSTLKPAVKDAVMASLELAQDKARFVAQTNPLTAACVSVAGATKIDPIYSAPIGLTASVRGNVEPWNVHIGIPLSVLSINKLNDPQLGGVTAVDPRGTGSSFHYLPVSVLPFWGRIATIATLKTKLGAIDSPNEQGKKLLSDGTGGTTDQVTPFATELAAIFDVTESDIANKRSELDRAFATFSSAISKAMVAATPTDPGAEPDKNNRTAYPNPFVFTPGASNYEGVVSPEYKSASYIQWEADHKAWQARKDTYDAAIAKATENAASSVAAIAAAQKECEDISHDIEALFRDRITNLDDLIATALDKIGMVQRETNPDGLVKIDADRIVEARFYAVTWVSDWGEESAPSPVTDLLNVDQNDSVTIYRPPLPPYGNVVSWRIYRSNVGNVGTDFQLVRDLPIARTIRASITDLAGGYAWKDDADWERIASLMILNDQNGQQYIMPTNNDHLQPGDKVGIKHTTTGVTRIRSWTGSAWTSAAQPEGAGSLGYVDGLSAKALGETCPSATWAEPPSVTANGTTTYLRGLVGGPNGVMAGFIDNFVAFCDPYHPYAWPVEYQQPLEYPIVGIGVFGQTWFVGTMGKPYLISGADPSSYTPQKLDSSQSCASRRSIVSNDGGVFYASPDGYCYCSIGGVDVVTQGLFSREDWQKLDPSSIFAVMHDNVLYFWYSGGGGGCYALDTKIGKLVSHDFLVTAVFDDVVTDAVYGVKDNALYKLFSTNRLTGTWKSGQMVLQTHVPLSWLQVWGDQSPDRPATINWYRDGVLSYSVDVTDNLPVRLPAGRFREHTIEVVSKARVTQVSMASSTQELQQI